MDRTFNIASGDRPLKLLLIGDYFPDIGGVALYTHKLAVEMVKHGFRVIVLHTKRGKSIDYHTIYVQRLPMDFKNRFHILLRGLIYIDSILKYAPFTLIKPREFLGLLELAGLMHIIIDKNRPILIHSNHLSLRSLAASIVAKRFALPVIVTSHGYDTEPPPSLYEYLLRRAVVSNADIVIALTNAKKNILDKLYSMPGKVVVIPNFIECDDMANASTIEDLEKLKSQKKEHYGFPPNRLILLYLGRIEREKGVFDVINAVSEICRINKSLCKNLKVIIAGTGSAEIELRSLLDTSSIENVKFVGKVYGDLKRDLLLLSDLLLFPTYLNETSPTVILEAYKYGTPVVSYPFRGIEELIRHEITGIILPQQDYRKLAKVIMDISLNRDEIYKMGLNALSNVKSFCSENAVNEITRIYISATSLKRH